MRSEGYCSWVCLCLCVCLLSHISPLEHLFVLKTLSRTQRATKVKKFVGFSLKPLRCRDPALPPLTAIRTYSRPFFLRKAARMRIIVFTTCGGVDRSGHFFPVPVQSCEFRELPLVMPPSKVCPQCNAVVPIRLKVCRNRLEFALYNADRVNFKSRNYHVVAYNISILAEGLHFSALVFVFIHLFPCSLVHYKYCNKLTQNAERDALLRLPKAQSVRPLHQRTLCARHCGRPGKRVRLAPAL